MSVRTVTIDVGVSAVAPAGTLLVSPFCTAVGRVLSGNRWLPTGLPLASTVMVVPRWWNSPSVSDESLGLSRTE